jgi:DNA-binding NarL/FixJ family response regulator
LRVLIADDSAVIRDSIKMVVERNPDWLVCGTASNGAEAIRQTASLQPDFVVMDLAMPVMDGFRAAAQICAKTPGVRIIMVTQYSSTSLRNEARKFGISEVINKADVVEFLVPAMAALANRKDSPEGPSDEARAASSC